MPSYWRGWIDYSEALSWMLAQRQRMLADKNCSGALLLCQHPPVITEGRHSNAKNLLTKHSDLNAQGIAHQKVDRGGDYTYHDPGQLMIYPVLRIGFGALDFLRAVSTCLITQAANYGVNNAVWREDDPGVWIGDRKLVACGLHIHRGICIHGFSLNIDTPLDSWRHIVPCGLQGPPPISLKEAISTYCSGRRSSLLSVACIAKEIEPALCQVLYPFGLDLKVELT